MVFNFTGGTPVAAAPAGSNTANATSNTNPSTPAAGFSFGGAAPSAPTPATNTAFGASPATGGTSSAAAPTGFFGAAAPAPSTGGGFGLAGGGAPASSVAAPFTTTTTAAPSNVALTVPCFDDLFPGRKIFDTVHGLLNAISSGSKDQADRAGQQLSIMLGDTNSTIYKQLLQVPLPSTVAPDINKRQRLQQTPVVNLSVPNKQGEIKLVEASLTPDLLQQVFSIADDLQVPEEVALCLLHQARSADPSARSKLVRKLGRTLVDSESRTAQEIYVLQRPMVLQTCLLLLQQRLQGNKEVLQATDAFLQAGWIGKIVDAVRSYSVPIAELVNLRNIPDSDAAFWRHTVTLHCLVEERQLASECLYFAAYHVQLQLDEVTRLIDLVRELSNALPVLDPYRDVPDPYEKVQQSNMSMFTTPRRTSKSPISWQQELAVSAWKMGLPQLLRCCSTVIMAVVCALGDRAKLMDRTIHAPILYAGAPGNALLPPGSVSIAGVSRIHSQLEKGSSLGWKREDVQGLLMGAFALLLRSSPSAQTSQRWKDFLKGPTDFRSFTFGRLCLLPALQQPRDDVVDHVSHLEYAQPCDTREFLLSTLAEFTSEYLEALTQSGNRPISRQKWEENARDDLSLQKLEQERQKDFRGKFQQYATDAIDSVPTSVNYLDRPDCMDDVIAFASSTCALGSNYASYFWQKLPVFTGSLEQEETFEFVPSKSLESLATLQAEGDSLQPSYFSFLAALSLATSGDVQNTGASVVHGLLAGEGSLQMARKHCKWQEIIGTLQWFATKLNSSDASRSSKLSGSSSGVSARSDSKAYYYFDTDGSDWANDRSSSRTASSSAKALELDEEETFILLSHLDLIASVAAKCAAARLSLTAIPLQGTGVGDGALGIGQSSTLVTLFELATTALVPEVRGAVFRTIACLLSTDGLPDFEMRDAAQRAWYLLEQCQILPTNILQRHPKQDDFAYDSSTGMAFPQSSIALGSKQKGQYSHQSFGILYEMESVESSRGFYPSTEGFLHLLKALVEAGGWPSDLGQNLRQTWGCAPYVEFVNFVLPKSLGQSSDQLPFRSADDQSRLLSCSLQVLDAVLCRYLLPDDIGRDFGTQGVAKTLHGITVEHARQALEAPYVADRVSVGTHDEDAQLSIDDFKNTGKTKSPGFSVLFQMLASGPHSLLHTVVAVLVERTSGDAVAISYDTLSLARSLYVSTPPTLSSARSGVSGSFSRSHQQTLLQGLRPPPDLVVDSSIPWDSKSVLLSLRLLTASIAREKTFQKLSKSSLPQHGYTPLLSFDTKTIIPSSSLSMSSPLCKSLQDSANPYEVLSCFSKLSGYSSSIENVDMEIATSALACTRTMMHGVSSQDLSVFQHSNVLARALAKRLSILAVGLMDPSQSEFFELFFRQILSDLGQRRLSFFVGALFGSSMANSKVYDCLDQLIELLQSDVLFSGGPGACLAQLCYELLYRSTKITSGQGHELIEFAAGTASRLRSMGFWEGHLRKSLYLSDLVATDFTVQSHLLLCVAWLLLGFAGEIDLLTGAYANQVGPRASALASYNPTFLRMRLSLLSEGILSRAVQILPLELISSPSLYDAPPPNIIARSKKALHASEYEVIDTEVMAIVLEEQVPSSGKDYISYANSWNDCITRDFCSSRLSSAIRVAIGTVILTSSSMNAESDGMLGLLDQIVWKMSTLYNLSDQGFFSATQSNLTRSLVSISTSMACRDCSQDVAEACSKLLSMITKPIGDEGTKLLLASALSSLLEENRLVIGTSLSQIELSATASLLARFAFDALSDKESLYKVALACSCLTKILKYLREASQTSSQVHGMLRDIVPAFVKCLSTAGETGVVRVLLEISAFPFGNKLLLKCDIFNAISVAAVNVQDPASVHDLFKLLSVLMAWPLKTEEFQVVCDVLRANNKILEQSLDKASTDLESLRTALSTIALAVLRDSCLNQDCDLSFTGQATSPLLDQNLVSYEILVKITTIFVAIISDPLSPKLMPASKTLSLSSAKPWWGDSVLRAIDPTGTQASTSFLSSDEWMVVSQGLDIARLGSIIFRGVAPPHMLDEHLVASLCRGLVNSLDGALILSDLLSSHLDHTGTSKKDLKRLLLKVNVIITEVLRLLLACVQKSNREGKAMSRTMTQVSQAIQYCSVKNLSSIVAVSSSETDENGLDFVSDLMKRIEQEASINTT